MQLAGNQLQLVCFRCHEQVDEASCFRSLEALWNVRFYAHCHTRSMLVDAPIELFNKIPDWRQALRFTPGMSPHRFIVGFEGEWEVKLRDDTWLLQRPRSFYAAFGVYRLDDLEQLFVPMSFQLDPKFFNIVHVESKLTIPAEFWFPVPESARSVPDIGNPLDRLFQSS